MERLLLNPFPNRLESRGAASLVLRATHMPTCGTIFWGSHSKLNGHGSCRVTQDTPWCHSLLLSLNVNRVLGKGPRAYLAQPGKLFDCCHPRPNAQDLARSKAWKGGTLFSPFEQRIDSKPLTPLPRRLNCSRSVRALHRQVAACLALVRLPPQSEAPRFQRPTMPPAERSANRRWTQGGLPSQPSESPRPWSLEDMTSRCTGASGRNTPLAGVHGGRKSRRGWHRGSSGHCSGAGEANQFTASPKGREKTGRVSLPPWDRPAKPSYSAPGPQQDHPLGMKHGQGRCG